MKITKVISPGNSNVINFIKKEISHKKARHIKMIESASPQTIAQLKSIKKIG